MQPIEEFIAATLLPLDEPVIQQTIAPRQQHRIRLPDAIITALAQGLPLLTRNVSDFQRIAGLQQFRSQYTGVETHYFASGASSATIRRKVERLYPCTLTINLL